MAGLHACTEAINNMSITATESGDFTSFDEVYWVLEDDMCGALFRFAADENIHAALAYPELPEGLARGTNAAASGASPRVWYTLISLPA
jgi:hypothetical protein